MELLFASIPVPMLSDAMQLLTTDWLPTIPTISLLLALLFEITHPLPLMPLPALSEALQA